jgi:hypothetical protein
MYVEIGAEAAQFPEKEYINGIFVAVEKTANRSTHDRITLFFSCILFADPPFMEETMKT